MMDTDLDLDSEILRTNLRAMSCHCQSTSEVLIYLNRSIYTNAKATVNPCAGGMNRMGRDCDVWVVVWRYGVGARCAVRSAS